LRTSIRAGHGEGENDDWKCNFNNLCPDDLGLVAAIVLYHVPLSLSSGYRRLHRRVGGEVDRHPSISTFGFFSIMAENHGELTEHHVFKITSKPACLVNVRINRSRPRDNNVHNEAFEVRVGRQGSVGLGESYNGMLTGLPGAEPGSFQDLYGRY
jgi:hypothetical protein